MKKLLTLLAFIFLIGSITNAQLLYYQWNPSVSPVTTNLNSIINNTSTQVIAGNDGKILYRIVPQQNWVSAVTGTTSNLYFVYGQSNIFSGGTSGTVLKSTDNGLNWVSVTPPAAVTFYSSASFVSQNYKIVCGEGGKIYTTTNLGSSWNEVTSGTTNALRNVYYNSSISNLKGYICGDNGTMLKLNYALPVPVTITVTPVNTGFSNNFNAVAALGDTNKLLLAGSGGIILKSTNAGASWVQQISGTANTLRFIYVLNPNDIWAGGDNGTILHTTNGGANWFVQSVNSSDSINSMIYLSTTKAMAVGSGGAILECNFPSPLTDTTIKRATLDANNIRSYFQTTGIFNQNSTLGNQPGFEWPKDSLKFAIFTSGLSISAMVNGQLRQAMCSYNGEYWPGQISGGVPFTTTAMNKIWKVSAGDNCNTSVDWANWGDVVPYGAPYRDMNNNGQYDPCTDIPGMRNANQTLFMVLTDGYANKHHAGEGFGGGTLPLNCDLKITAYTYPDTSLKDVQFVKFDIINRGSAAWNNLYMALDGDYDLGDAVDDYLCMDSTRNMWIGYNGDNMDGNGGNYTYGANPPAVGMRVLKFPVNKSVSPFDTLKPSVGVRTSCGGCSDPTCEWDPNGEPNGAYLLMKGFKKDGSHWMSPIFTPPRPVKFIYSGDPEPNTGWTELKGMIRNCGGDTGAYQPVNQPGDRRFVLGMGKDNFTMNPGDSQTVVIAQFIARGTSNLNSVTKLKQLSDFIASYTVGINQISTEVPGAFALSQNYPNPFNPETKIKFTIPSFGSIRNEAVTLKVFDMLGREVSVLVNESLNPGIYEVTFDGTKLSSGIYFYRLQMGVYSDTKKMVLLR